MKVIFLDVDGVLNNNKDTIELTPGGWLGVSDILVERLQRVAAATDAKVVLTSTWKNADESELDYLYKKLNFCKPIAFTKENERRGSFYRGGGILDYITAHQNIEQFVIFDDYIFDFEEQGLLDHFVWTNEKEGLTEEKAQQAIRILEGTLNSQDEIDKIKVDIREWEYHR